MVLITVGGDVLMLIISLPASGVGSEEQVVCGDAAPALADSTAGMTSLRSTIREGSVWSIFRQRFFSVFRKFFVIF